MEMRKLYISDLHFGHVNVTKAGRNFDNREFKDLDEMHDIITKKWNTVVTNADHVYICGDMCWNVDNRSIDYYEKLVKNLNGNKHLIIGNHDNIKNSRYKKLFNEITPYKEVTDTLNNANKKVILSHYYMPFYNAHYRNAVMLHGHSHNSSESDMERRITAMLNRQGYPCAIYNVGCMYPYIDYAPRTLQYIVDNYDTNKYYGRNQVEDDDFENIVQALLDYHDKFKCLRFGQTIVNILGQNPFYTTDKEALQKICSKIENHNEVKVYK